MYSPIHTGLFFSFMLALEILLRYLALLYFCVKRNKRKEREREKNDNNKSLLFIILLLILQLCKVSNVKQTTISLNLHSERW